MEPAVSYVRFRQQRPCLDALVSHNESLTLFFGNLSLQKYYILGIFEYPDNLSNDRWVLKIE